MAVVGGGPAGLKVAEIAAKRGCRVTLLEKDHELGGLVNLAARQPEHAVIGEVTAYLEAQLAELSVEIRRGALATPDALRALAADAIVIATGSEPNLPNVGAESGARSRALGRQALPDIPGLDLPFVVSCDDVLSSRVTPRGKVIVIDDNGHWEAAGSAEFLADLGCDVEIVASHSLIGEEIESGARTLFYRRAAIKGMKLRPNFALLEIADRRVKIGAVFSSGNETGWGKYVLIPSDEQWIEDVDWVVPVIGRRSRENLYLDLKASPDFKGVEILQVGDCVAPRLIQSVMIEAVDLACAL